MTNTETETIASPALSPERPGTASNLGLAWSLIVLGVGAAAVALLGPFGFDLIVYHASETAVNQIVGGDVAGLILVSPVALVAGFLVWRKHRAGPVLALGPAFYALYMYGQLALGGDVARYPGNSEQFFPLFLGLFIVAGWVAIGAWRTIDSSEIPVTSAAVDRFLGWYALVVATFLTLGLHLRGLLEVWANQPGPEYLSDPVIFWLVKFMDLGLVVPALVVVGVGVLRRAEWVTTAKYAAVGWMALLGSSVAGMALTMQFTNDPSATLANTLAFGSFALIGIAVAVVVYRPLFGEESATTYH